MVRNMSQVVPFRPKKTAKSRLGKAPSLALSCWTFTGSLGPHHHGRPSLKPEESDSSHGLQGSPLRWKRIEKPVPLTSGRARNCSGLAAGEGVPLLALFSPWEAGFALPCSQSILMPPSSYRCKRGHPLPTSSSLEGDCKTPGQPARAHNLFTALHSFLSILLARDNSYLPAAGLWPGPRPPL